MRVVSMEVLLMRSLQQQKQRKLNLGPVADVPSSFSSEEFIASHLSESPIPPIRRDSWSQSLSGVT